MGTILASCVVASNDKDKKNWTMDPSQKSYGIEAGSGTFGIVGMPLAGSSVAGNSLLQVNVDRWAAISHNSKMAVKAKVLKSSDDISNAGICDNEKLKDFTYELWKQGELLQSKLKGRNTNMRTMLDIIQNTSLNNRLSAISNAIAFLDDTAPAKK